MSCLGPLYNPSIPKEWSRFENRCVYQQTFADTVDINTQVYIPQIQKTVPIGSVQYELAMLSKGNVLQYKKNSANITKSQKYAQISRGAWTNRTTTWASQTQTTTSPNIKSLRRVNYTNVTIINGIAVPTTDPITCPSPLNPVYPVLPNSSGSQNPNPPPIIPPTPNPPGPTGPILPPFINIPIPSPIVIPDGGSLVCNVIENICTGEIYSITADQRCYPTSDSDVPGPIIDLCYNNNSLPTYYPRTKTTYGTSGNKWPTNNKIWGTANSTSIIHNVSSIPNNNTLSLIPLTAPINLTASAGDGEVVVSWSPPLYTGGNPIINYIVATYTGSSINPDNLFSTTNTPNTSIPILGLINNTLYTFVVTAVTSAKIGPKSKSVSATPRASTVVTPITVPNAPIYLYANVNDSQITLNWTAPIYNGGSPILNYIVTTTTGRVIYPSVLTNTTATITPETTEKQRRQ